MTKSNPFKLIPEIAGLIISLLLVLLLLAFAVWGLIFLPIQGEWTGWWVILTLGGFFGAMVGIGWVWEHTIYKWWKDAEYRWDRKRDEERRANLKEWAPYEEVE